MSWRVEDWSRRLKSFFLVFDENFFVNLYKKCALYFVLKKKINTFERFRFNEVVKKRNAYGRRKEFC